ncbi:MAG: amidohydrolase [Candidatus Tectomicrobia bacterium]
MSLNTSFSRNVFRGLLPGIALAVGSLAVPAVAVEANGAKIIFFGGPILTMESETPTVQAVAIANGRIVAAGDRGTVFRRRGEGTQLIDLDGKTLLPGFHNPHVHPTMAAVTMGWEDVSGYSHPTVEASWQALRDAVKKHQPGEWVFAVGWDPILVEGLQAPTLKQLDDVSRDNPLFITPQGGHQAYLNSRALEAAGITAESPDPGHGAYYERDENGDLTGRLVEQPAFFPVQEKYGMPKTRAAWEAALQEVFRYYAKMGITSVTTMGVMIPLPEVLEIYEELTASDPVIRHNVFLTWYARDQLRKLQPGAGHDYFRYKGMKIWYDGSPYSATMLVEESYLNNAYTRDAIGIKPGAVGHANWSETEFYQAADEMHRLGWQLGIHTQGGRATREVLRVLEDVVKHAPRGDTRHRFEHLMLAKPASFNRFAQAGFGASFHIQHVYYFGRILRDSLFGEARAKRLLPVQSALAAGLKPSLHSDHPMFPSTPLQLIQTAVTRHTRQGDPVAEEQGISVEQALRAMTINPAWQVHEEDNTGSIAVGKLADLVVLSENPLEISPEHLHRITVDATYVGGSLVWKAGSE